jgi:hypothetical protein
MRLGQRIGSGWSTTLTPVQGAARAPEISAPTEPPRERPAQRTEVVGGLRDVPGPPGRPRPKLRSPRRTVLATIAAVVAVSGSGVVAYRNQQSAVQWQERARMAEAHATGLAADNDELAGDLSRTRQAFAQSEEDVATLEVRLGEVSNEKAVVEDEREFAVMVAERLIEVSDAYDTVASQFQRCIDEQFTWTRMMVGFDSYAYSGSTYRITQQGTVTAQVCGQAERDLRLLRGYIDALGG